MSVTNQQVKPKNSAQPVQRVMGLASIALSAALTLAACGGSEHEEVTAVDKVEEAAEMARANAPEAEVLEFDDTATTTAATDEASKTDTGEASEVDAPAETEDTAKAATVSTEEAPLSADAGKSLYDSTCQMCHATGLLNAPKFGDKEAWAPRIAKGKETLYQHSAKGFNQMPAQAVNGVSEAQVHAAVDYMVSQSS